MTMLKYTLYVWTEEKFRAWGFMNQGIGCPSSELTHPASFEMYDVSEDEVKIQMADYFDCEPDDVIPIEHTAGRENQFKTVFGLTFWDVFYPDGIGSYLIALNTLED